MFIIIGEEYKNYYIQLEVEMQDSHCILADLATFIYNDYINTWRILFNSSYFITWKVSKINSE